MNNTPVIQLKNLYKSFGERIVLQNITLDIQEGENFVIIGRSGTGKSVLLKSMIGLLQPNSGQIIINGIDITNLGQGQRIKLDLGLGMLFQSSALFDSLTVLDNIVFGIAVHSKLSKEKAKDIAVQNLQLVGMDESVLDLYPASLSGGMQKRVSLARLLAMKPKILLFDEPTSGLDPVMSRTISKLIVDITKYLKATSITITHDMKSAKTIAKRIAMLDDAEIKWVGTPAELDNTDNIIVRNFIHGRE